MPVPCCQALAHSATKLDEVFELAVEVSSLVLQQPLDVAAGRPTTLPDGHDVLNLGQGEPEPRRLSDKFNYFEDIAVIDTVSVRPSS